MFAVRRGKVGFNQPLNSWRTDAVTNMLGMFAMNNVFNQPLNSWQTGKAANMQNVFTQSSFNQNIDSWQPATKLFYMFSYAGAFDQNIDSWQMVTSRTCRACSP